MVARLIKFPVQPYLLAKPGTIAAFWGGFLGSNHHGFGIRNRKGLLVLGPTSILLKFHSTLLCTQSAGIPLSDPGAPIY
jgi:hypothetical protein